jgi:hypothetical protein
MNKFFYINQDKNINKNTNMLDINCIKPFFTNNNNDANLTPPFKGSYVRSLDDVARPTIRQSTTNGQFGLNVSPALNGSYTRGLDNVARPTIRQTTLRHK